MARGRGGDWLWPGAEGQLRTAFARRQKLEYCRPRSWGAPPLPSTQLERNTCPLVRLLANEVVLMIV